LPFEALLYCPLARKADQLPRLYELEARVLLRILRAIREQEPVGTRVQCREQVAAAPEAQRVDEARRAHLLVVLRDF
jgi:hypothetical protein